MKIIFVSLLLFTAMIPFSKGQSSDSLKLLLEKTPQDTNRIKLLLQIAENYFFSKSDTCLFFAEKARHLSKKLHFINGEVHALNMAGESLRFLGDYPRALMSVRQSCGWCHQLSCQLRSQPGYLSR